MHRTTKTIIIHSNTLFVELYPRIRRACQVALAKIQVRKGRKRRFIQMKKKYTDPVVQTVKLTETEDILLNSDVDIDVGGLYGGSTLN